MYISQNLILLLKTFSKHDLNRFEKYLHSPFFNENERLIRLFDVIGNYLVANKKNIADQSLEKERVWYQIIKDEPYVDVKMRRLSSDLYKMANSFLAYKAFKEQPRDELLFQLKALNNPDLQKAYDSTLKQLHTLQQKIPLRDTDFYYYQHLIEENLYKYRVYSKDTLVATLKKTDFALDCFYYSKKLHNLCDAISQSFSFSDQVLLNYQTNLLIYLEENGYTEVPSIKAYYLILKMLTESEGEPYFFKLKEFIHLQDAYFSKKELNTIFTHLQNYCILKKMNIGKHEFQYELFSLYKIALKKEILFDQGTPNASHYKNIITIGLIVEEYEWVEDFIQKYTIRLPKNHRKNALTYNLSKVFFYKKEYNKVIQLLQEVEYKQHVYALGSKDILLRTYYELGEFIALDSLINSFRIYIRRNKLISKEVKQQYLNMLRFVKKLSNIVKGDQKAIDKIRVQIDKCKALAVKKWIVEKVEELE